MLTSTRQCPHCGGYDTDRVHVEWMSDSVEEIWICNECPTEYTVGYGDPMIVDQRTEEAEAD